MSECLENFNKFISERNDFGIKVTIVEPGGIRTDWAGSSMVHGQLIQAYVDTPADKMRQLLGIHKPNGDPNKMANAIINMVKRENVPLRLALGTDAYALLKQHLPKRLEQLEAEKEVTLSTDADDKDTTAGEWRRLLRENEQLPLK